MGDGVHVRGCVENKDMLGSSPHRDGCCDQQAIAVTAIESCGRVLTVVSRFSDQVSGLLPYTTLSFGVPGDQLRWRSATRIESLRNHVTAVSKLIDSISSNDLDAGQSSASAKLPNNCR
jgi:hypothetical protein